MIRDTPNPSWPLCMETKAMNKSVHDGKSVRLVGKERLCCQSELFSPSLLLFISWRKLIKTRMVQSWVCQPQVQRQIVTSQKLSTAQPPSFWTTRFTNLTRQFLNFSKLANHMQQTRRQNKRVTLQVSSSLHSKIKNLSKEREETITQFVLTVLDDFLYNNHFKQSF